MDTSFGGWVSDNWLEFGRILRWAFLVIDDMDSSLELEKKMQQTVQNKWTKKMNKFRLRSRILDSDGLAEELGTELLYI